MKTTIYHNPRCSKSRQTLELLDNNKIEYQVIEYLKQPLDSKELKIILKLLKLPVQDVLRTKEIAYKDNQLNNPKLSEQEILDVIVANPILLERPIVIHNNKAAICRPPELVLDLIK